MQLDSVNEDQRLYVMPSGGGFTCYGFDVLDRKVRAVQWWIEKETESSEERRDVRLWLDRVPDVGTCAHFEHCAAMMDRGSKFSLRTGKRCDAELVPALVGLEGRRVECLYFGERIRFYVGKSMGWMPAHLRIKTRRSLGGEALILDQVRAVRIIK